MLKDCFVCPIWGAQLYIDADPLVKEVFAVHIRFLNSDMRGEREGQVLVSEASAEAFRPIFPRRGAPEQV